MIDCNILRTRRQIKIISLRSSLVHRFMVIMTSQMAFISVAEPKAILRKWAYSLLVFLDDPSAILRMIEVDARQICELNPNNSSFGNEPVNT